MNDLFHKILVYLYDYNGLNIDLCINDFLKQELGDKCYDNETLMKVGKVLEVLNTSKYISIQSIPQLGKYNFGNSKSGHNNLDDHELFIKLELLGHNYIADKLSKQRQDNLLERQTNITEKTSEFTTNNGRTTTKIAIVSIFIGFVGTIATIKSCQISKDANSKDQEIEQLKTSQQQLKDSIAKIYHLASFRKDSITYLKNQTKHDTTKQTKRSTNSQQ